MVWISPIRLAVNPTSERPLHEWVNLEKPSALCLRGYGVVAENAQWMGEMYPRIIFTRKLRSSNATGGATHTGEDKGTEALKSMTQNPREPFDRFFDPFNEHFARVAKDEGLIFERRAGPNIGRGLRLKDDPLKRGVFLELKYNWTKSDFVDPLVTLAYSASFQARAPEPFPHHFFSTVLYEGTLSGLQPHTVAHKLKIAVAEVKAVSQEKILREGKVFTGWPKDASEAGSYYE